MTPEERFVEPISGPAYRTHTKLFTLGLVVTIFAFGIRNMTSQTQQISHAFLFVIACALLVIGVTTWYIFTAKTTLNKDGIKQDWFFPKQFTWQQITRVKFIRLPFSSRLLIVCGKGPFKAVDSGCKELDEAFFFLEKYYLSRA